MRIVNLICSTPELASLFVRRHVDTICCILLFGWAWASCQYFLNYDEVYVPNALVIDHYLNLTVFGWVFLLGLYVNMRPWGKVSFIGFTGMLLVNTYQIHIHFEDNYFIIWLGLVYFIVLVGYAWCSKIFFEQMFNSNFY